MQLDYIETYVHEKLVWISSDDQVISVEDGMLTAHKLGEADITVRGGEYSDTIHVNVKVDPSTIDISDLEKTIECAEAVDLNLYEDTGKTEFKTALENAKRILADPVNQETVDTAVDTLNKAMSNLVRIAVIPVKPADSNNSDKMPESPKTGDLTIESVYECLLVISAILLKNVCK